MAHFPSRETTKDAIILGDVSEMLREESVSVVGLIEACKELKREATNDNPFLPPSGEILRRSVSHTRNYQSMEMEIRRPARIAIPSPEKMKPSSNPVPQLIWSRMSDEEKNEMWSKVIGQAENVQNRYFAIHGINPKEANEWREGEEQRWAESTNQT